MSLFKSKDWWSTEVNENQTELISFANLTLGRLGEEGTGDIIIFGGPNGILQLFKPQQSYQPTDLLLEFPTDEPIVQISTGKFVFGSYNESICVLHQRKLQIYSYVSKEGQTEYGDQNNLSLEYCHNLPSHSLHMVHGNFGGIIGKDFISVLCLDGQLLFFEQEVATFACIIPNICIPSPFEYCHTSDSFIFCNNDLMLESYSYHNLGQHGTVTNKRNAPDWVYNIGDGIKYMEKVQTSNNYCSLFALSDRVLYCLLDNGTLKYMKRFDYEPICFHAYLVGWYHEPNSHLMTMVVSDTSTLFIYEQTTLLWACQLTCLPMTIKRGFFPGLSGCIVMLADDGALKCSYLGTEPDLFTAPALAAVDVDFEKAQDELDKLQNQIDTFNDSVEMTIANKTAEKEIELTVDVHAIRVADNPNLPYGCKVAIILKPGDKNNIESMEVMTRVDPPLICSNGSQSFLEMAEEMIAASDVFWDQDSDLFPTSSQIQVVVSFVNKQGYSRIIKRVEKIPFEVLFKGAEPVKDAKFKITISTNANVVDIAQLFKDIDFSNRSTASTAIGLTNYCKNGDEINDNIVSIVAGKSSQRYRIQSNSIKGMGLVVKELCDRLHKHLVLKTQYNKEEVKKTGRVVTFTGPLQSEILDIVSFNMERHLLLRMRIAEAEESLDILSSQFITIQKRLIVKYRERPPSSCDDLFFLLSDTHHKILTIVADLQNSQNEVFKRGNELKCCIGLLESILKITEKDKTEVDKIMDALNPDALDTEEQRWEETALSSALHLLSSAFPKTENKIEKFSSVDPLAPIIEYNVKKCIKYINIFIENTFNNTLNENKVTKDEQETETVLEKPEDNNKILSVPEGSSYGMKIVTNMKKMEDDPKMTDGNEKVIFV